MSGGGVTKLPRPKRRPATVLAKPPKGLSKVKDGNVDSPSRTPPKVGQPLHVGTPPFQRSLPPLPQTRTFPTRLSDPSWNRLYLVPFDPRQCSPLNHLRMEIIPTWLSWRARGPTWYRKGDPSSVTNAQTHRLAHFEREAGNGISRLSR